eukprot:3260629-Pleurochrysis_carterae.AAC.2
MRCMRPRESGVREHACDSPSSLLQTPCFSQPGAHSRRGLVTTTPLCEDVTDAGAEWAAATADGLPSAWPAACAMRAAAAGLEAEACSAGCSMSGAAPCTLTGGGASSLRLIEKRSSKAHVANRTQIQIGKRMVERRALRARVLQAVFKTPSVLRTVFKTPSLLSCRRADEHKTAHFRRIVLYIRNILSTHAHQVDRAADECIRIRC